MGVSGRVMTGAVVETGTTIGTLSRDACGRRSNGVWWLVSRVGVGLGRTGIGGSSWCRRILLITVVDGGA